MTDKKFTHTFSPGTIGTLNLKNRLVVPAMATMYAKPDGTVSDRLITYHETKAKGGWGLIITEDFRIGEHVGGFNNLPGLWRDDQIPGYKRLTDTIHAHGAKIAVQIYHAGRQAPRGVTGTVPVAPSPIPDPVMGEMPHELTREEIQEIVTLHADAAFRAKQAGFDAVEIHGAHGYLLSTFLSPFSNKRTDEYGGTQENRARFSCEVVRAIRRKVGAGFPLIFRLSVEELVYGGITLQDTQVVAKMLEREGVDAIHASVGVGATQHFTIASASQPHAWISNYAAGIKEVVKIPVICVNRITDPEQAEVILQTGKADFVAMGRASLADPDLPKKAETGKSDEINHCIGCLQRCIGFLAAGKPISCLVNPACGREKEFEPVKAAGKKKVLVVGGGPSGMEAAIVAARRGHEVLLYEKNDRLGGLWNLAAMPPGKEDYNQLTVWQRTELERLNVRVILNTRVDRDMVKTIGPDALILAAGSKPAPIPIPGLQESTMITSNQILAGTRTAGKKVLVIGGGFGGPQTAGHLAVHGHSVTLVTKSPGIGANLGPGNRYHLLKLLHHYQVTLVTGASVRKVIPGGVVADLKEGEREITGFDTLVFVDRLSPDNELATACAGLVPEIIVVGDARTIGDGGDAVLSGYEAGLKI